MCVRAVAGRWEIDRTAEIIAHASCLSEMRRGGRLKDRADIDFLQFSCNLSVEL